MQVCNVASVLEGDCSRAPVTADPSSELHLVLPASGAALRIVFLSASRSLFYPIPLCCLTATPFLGLLQTGQTEVEKAAIKRMKAEGRWHGDEESGGGGALSPSSPPASPPTSNGASNRPLPPVGSEGEIESGGQATTDSHGLPGAISSPKGGVNRHNGVNGPASPSSGTVGSPSQFPPPKRKGFNLVDDRLLGGRWVEESDPATLRMFLRILALCHTAIPEGEPTPDKIVYQVESPDEGALVQAANIFGFFFYR
jgi:hypothetical protein